MAGPNGVEEKQGTRRPGVVVRLWRKAWVKTVLALLVLGAVGMGIAAMYVARHAEPILRKRVVETLAARFRSPVELDHLGITVLDGLQVTGTGLRILYLAGPEEPDAAANPVPMVTVQEFSFRTRFKDLLHSPTRVGLVHVQGLILHVPPASRRQQMFGYSGKGQPKIELLVDRIVCDDAKIYIETDKPGKDPLEFDVKRVVLRDVGAAQPFLYDAELTNPKPVGEIHATGHFGPWQSEEPRATTIDGDYSFDHADLNSIKGLGGMLSSTGHYYGQLGHVTIDGTTDTPDFSLDVSDHPLPLTTKFHAYVDGTTGDTTLDPVEGMLAHSKIVARGTVMQVHGLGHDIALTTSVPQGNVQDLLALGMKSWPPVMRGGVTVAAKLHIPPGSVPVSRKIELNGTVHISAVELTNPKLQDKIDSLSERAQGHPQDSGGAGSDKKAEVASQIMTQFVLAHSLMTFSTVDYKIPGAEVQLHGAYGMQGSVFEFKGHVRTKATASEMTTGWKAMLIKPFNKLLEKHGAGLELPIEIHGRGNDVHFGLAFGSADESQQDMAAEVKAEGKRPPAPVAKKKSK
ncbi:MAG: hypothetical protein V4555_06990 [Acidobacteriota bacterium]